MCGIAGAGKSTWLNKNFVEDRDYVISRDAIRFSLLKDKDDYFSKEDEVFKTFVRYIQESLDNPEIPENIYCDATHITEKSRNKLLDALDLTNVKNISCIVVKPSLDETLRRNEQRTGRAYVPRSVIRRMFWQFQRPEYDTKYPKDVRYVEVSD
ncbi:MAG: ATP-binding protein [Bacillota bacterium]|nr:ATP-binding protein [Bacillota bacterium]